MKRFAVALILVFGSSYPCLALPTDVAVITTACATKVVAPNQQISAPHRPSVRDGENPRFLAASATGEMVLIGTPPEMQNDSRKMSFTVLYSRTSHFPLSLPSIVESARFTEGAGKAIAMLYGTIDTANHENVAVTIDKEGYLVDKIVLPSHQRITAQAVSKKLHVIGMQDGTLISGESRSRQIPVRSQEAITGLIISPDSSLIFAISSGEITVVNSRDFSLVKRITINPRLEDSPLSAEYRYFMKPGPPTLTPDGKSFLALVAGSEGGGGIGYGRAVLEISMESLNITHAYQGFPASDFFHSLQTFTVGKSSWAILSSSDPVNEEHGRAVLFELNGRESYQVISMDQVSGYPLSFGVSGDGRTIAMPTNEGKILLVNRFKGTSQAIQFSDKDESTVISRLVFSTRAGREYLRIISWKGEIWEVTPPFLSGSLVQ